MDTRIIEVRKNIIISRFFNENTTAFSEDINIDFIPDEVSIKLLNFDAENATTDCFGIYSDLVSDILVSFIDNAPIIITPHNLLWTLRKPVRGRYNFRFLARNANNELGNGVVLAPAILFLHLEFIKYRTDLPDKKIF